MQVDYFKLPFEVHYSGEVPVFQLEFKSDIDVQSLSDIKVVQKSQGNSNNPSFVCNSNSGAELYCCIKNGHDQVDPEWLDILAEDEINIDYMTNLKFVVSSGEIEFVEMTFEELDEESDAFIDLDEMEYCEIDSLTTYELESVNPDYLVLDSQNSRVRVNLDGYILDSEGAPTDTRLFDPEMLHEIEQYQEYSSRNFWEVKSEWINSVVAQNFPSETGVALADDGDHTVW